MSEAKEEVSEARHESASVAGASDASAQRSEGLARANECKELGGTGQAPNGQELGGAGQAPNQQELGGTGQAPNQQKTQGEAAAGPQANDGFRSGFVALLGRSNAGKSTLVNALVSAKVSITAPKPQTTRNRIRGIIQVPERAQLVLVDTPGVHGWRDKELNRRMVDDALASIGDADAVLMVVDVERALDREGRIHPDDLLILEQLAKSGVPAVLAINKLDKLKQRDRALVVIDAFRQAHTFRHVVGISALVGAQLELLLEALVEVLPPGPVLFPDDLYTDQSSRFLAAEILREQTIRYTGKEIPFSVASEIERFEVDSSAD
ncbi:MAG: GTPase Era, partial [Myxococcota bacterium]|nr:GTPase Era [Myxococcota bacterium]